MYHHDVRHTGQSHLLGPLFPAGAPAAGNVKTWQGTDKIRTSPALSADGSTLYVGLGFDFCAIDHRDHGDELVLSPACRRLGLLAGRRDRRHDLHRRPGQYLQRLQSERHDQVPDQPRVRGRHLGPHRDRPGDPPRAASAGHHLLRPRPDHGGRGHLHGRSTRTGRRSGSTRSGTSRRQSSPAIDAERHDLPRRSMWAISTPSATRGRRISRACREGRGGSGSTRSAARRPASPRRPSSPRTRPRSISGRAAPSPAFPWASPRSTSPIRACFSSTPPTCNPIRWTFATIGKVDQTPALGRRRHAVRRPQWTAGQKRLYAVNPNGTPEVGVRADASWSDTSAVPHRRRRWGRSTWASGTASTP